MEYEAVVVSLRSREALRVHHELERFNPLRVQGGNTRIGRRGSPHSETGRDHSGGNGMPDRGFGHCDGHHETVDFRIS
jgi:hypothetical protein